MFTASAASQAQGIAPVRLAILTGEGDRAVSEAALPQLEVALPGVKEITLLNARRSRRS